MNWWCIQENISLYLTRCPKISLSLFLFYDCSNCWFLGMLFLNHSLVISDLLIRSLYYSEWDYHTSMRKEIILFDRGLHFHCKQYLDLNRAWSFFFGRCQTSKKHSNTPLLHEIRSVSIVYTVWDKCWEIQFSLTLHTSNTTLQNVHEKLRMWEVRWVTIITSQPALGKSSWEKIICLLRKHVMPYYFCLR